MHQFIRQFLDPDVIAWIPAFVYFFASWPQIIKNFKIKSDKAISHRMLYLAFIGGAAKGVYNIFLDLPLPYKIMRPLILCCVLTMVIQGYIYARDRAIRKNLFFIYSITLAVLAGVILYGLYDPIFIGNKAGWLSTTVLAIYQFPQVIKNWRRKSVAGISFIYLSMLCTGALLEISIAFLFGLPVQSFYNGCRGVMYYLIFTYQFFIYGGFQRQKG